MGCAFEESFREEGFEGLGEVQGEGVAASVGVGVEEADGRVERGAAQGSQDAGVDQGVEVADEGVAGVGGGRRVRPLRRSQGEVGCRGRPRRCGGSCLPGP